MQIIHLTDDQMTDILTNIRVNKSQIPSGSNGYILDRGDGTAYKIYKSEVTEDGKLVDKKVSGWPWFSDEKKFGALEEMGLELTEFPKVILTYNGRYIGNIQKFYRGETLQKIYKSGKLSNEQKIDLLRQWLNVIHEYEKYKILYRDMHPGNYIVEDGKLRPIDFEGTSSDNRPWLELEQYETFIANMYWHFLEHLCKTLETGNKFIIDEYNRIAELDRKSRNGNRNYGLGVVAKPEFYNYEAVSEVIDNFEEHLRGK